MFECVVRIRFPQNDRIAAIPSTFRPQTAFLKQQNPPCSRIGRAKQKTPVRKSAAAYESEDILWDLHFSVKPQMDKISLCKGNGCLRHGVGKVAAREMKNRVMGYFGSYTWASAAVKKLAEYAEKLKFELVGNPVEMKQSMGQDTARQAKELAKAMAERLKADRK